MTHLGIFHGILKPESFLKVRINFSKLYREKYQ